MPVDIKLLRKHGVSSGEYKKIFTMPTKPARVQKLIDLITNRLKDGYMRNLADYRIYAAIDYAYELAFKQITPTFVQHLLSRNLKPEELLAEVEKLGLRAEDIFLRVKAGDGKDARDVYIPNPPVFYQVFIPLVRAYCTARIAALYNQRNKSPLLGYKPLLKTARNRVIAEIVTNMTETISTWYGYPSYLDQFIKQTVKYGVALSFPCEEWHSEKQARFAEDGETEEVATQKEGIRYLFPHPSRMFYDLYSPATTMNTGTGCEYAGHWQIIPFSEILDDRKFWNRKCVAFGTNWFDNPLAGNYFSEFYPCQLQYPVVMAGADAKREDKAAFYASSERDKAVFQTHMYMLINPKEWGLGRYEEDEKGKDKLADTYDHSVWHHFIVAGDSTVIWAEPCAYNPNWFAGYDYDYQSGRQTSLGLEAIPWQDHLGNIITQMMLTAKQNLANVTFYDTNIVDKRDVESLQNLGESKYRSLNFIPYDSLKFSKGGGLDIKGAFSSVQFNYRTIQDMIQMMGSILDVMERVLQFTAQEVGSTAKHYQSAKEIETTNESSDSRVNYTGASIDSGIDAWKRQIYTAQLAYRDDDVEAQVSSDIPDVEKILADLGFEIADRIKDKLVVKGKKHTLRLEEWAKSGEGQEQDADPQTAQAMFQTLGIIVSHEPLFQAIGAKRIISLLEEGAKIAGADKDFKLPIDTTAQPQPGQPAPGQPPAGQPGQPPAPSQGQPQPPNPQQQLQAMIQQTVAPMLQQLQQAVVQFVETKIAKPAAAEMVKQESEIKQIAAMVIKLEQALQQALRPAQPQGTPAPTISPGVGQPNVVPPTGQPILQ